MNLRALANPATATINPNVPVTVQFSQPPTVGPDFTPVANYSAPVPMSAQVQPTSSRDLRMLDGINLGGEIKTIFLYGEVQTVIRVNQQGGDLITLPDGSVYLVNQVPELWPDWVKAICTLQNGS